jgi:hypothetical protein
MYTWHEIVPLKEKTVDRPKEVPKPTKEIVGISDFLKRLSLDTRSNLQQGDVVSRDVVSRDGDSYIQKTNTSQGSSYTLRAAYYQQELIIINAYHQKGDPVHLSDAMFDTWNQALNKNLGMLSSLLRIIDRPIQNPETRDALRPYRPSTAQPYRTMSSFRPGDTAFQEELQKPLGRATRHMLIDHRQPLGDKQITHIDVIWGNPNNVAYSVTYHLR